MVPRLRPARVNSKRPPLRVVIFGVQGSGKGTQAELLARRYGLVHVATGDLFRHEVARQTALGRRAEAYLSAGKLVPDVVTNAMVRERLRRPDARRHGFVLDGYPRNRSQLRALERFVRPNSAIEIQLPDREAVRRIAGRRSCICGMVYHVVYQPPRRPGRCDRCGRRLFIRQDDRPAAIRRRLRDYHRRTALLLAHFRRRGVLHRVDGRPAIPEVFRGVVAALMPSARRR